MNKILGCLALTIAFLFAGCKKSDFSDNYANPTRIPTTIVEKQYAGFLQANIQNVVPSYDNYFIALRTTLNHYTQATGWENYSSQYVPGAASIGWKWNNYYNFLAQYRTLENVFSKLNSDDQQARRIFMITAAIYLYDHTQKVVDLHGDIPWTNAGKINENGGDYAASLPKYDKAEAVYTKMLDDLKAFADELNTIQVPVVVQAGFKNQDFINNGDINKWKRYCNSLRIRMLTRISEVAVFKTRVSSEISQILANTTMYPTIENNNQNIQVAIFDLNSPIHSRNFQSGLEDWGGNVAGKVMIEHMKGSFDPRLRAVFEPGEKAAGVYLGLDQALKADSQSTLLNSGKIAFYNRSTISRNDFFPGVLINAAEISFAIAEYYIKSGNMASAKTAYEKGIDQSVEYYYSLRAISNDNVAGTLQPTNATEITTYKNAQEVKWDNTTTNVDRLRIVALQKWLHYNVIQPEEAWAELRRLNYPVLTFETDISNDQKQPPVRWIYNNSELIYNTQNYNEVRSNDKLTTRIFWDMN